MKNTHWRQGDVLVRAAAAKNVEAAKKAIPKDAGRIVLAYGEVTGHSHAIQSDSARFVINEQTQQRYLTLDKAEFLRHEEHGEIQLPAGNYEVVIQREYTPMGLRNVAD